MLNRNQSAAAVHGAKTGELHNLNFKDEEIPLETYYLADGSHLSKATPKVLAKRVKLDSGILYYLKFGPDGLYDPLGMYSNGSQNIECRRFGKNVWDYKKVTEFAFDLYIKYLLTKNKTYYVQASREVKN